MKSFCATPALMRYCPAGVSGSMRPAGEMWSVVTLSPSRQRTRADLMGLNPGASSVMPSKKGGFWM